MILTIAKLVTVNSTSKRKVSVLNLIGYLLELAKDDEKKLGKLMRKQINADDFEESVEDLNDFGKQTGIKSTKEYDFQCIKW